MRCTTVTVLATASTQSVTSSRTGRSKVAEAGRHQDRHGRSARSAMPTLALKPSDSALARAYDVTAPITRQYER